MAYSTISKPSLYFNTKLYTGANKSVTGVGFQPDWVWIKERDAGYHSLFDVLRGTTEVLSTNVNAAGHSVSDSLTSFDSDGFTLGADSSNYVGGSSQATVSWNWKANGTGSANTDGSTNSTISVSSTSGFSIVSYTGTGSNATVGHGLGASPDVVIIKKTNTAEDWLFQTSALGYSSGYLVLNSNGASATNNGSLINSVSSTTLSIGTNSYVNSSGHTYIAYCFAEKKGFSKFGKYIGNGNNNGTFVYTGFKPAWIMTKMSSGVQTWNIFDNRRNGYNPTERNLQANLSNAEDTGRDLDILSNGFKQRNGGAEGNGNSSTYIYMAFAEEPLVANVGQSIPATAR